MECNCLDKDKCRFRYTDKTLNQSQCFRYFINEDRYLKITKEFHINALYRALFLDKYLTIEQKIDIALFIANERVKNKIGYENK